MSREAKAEALIDIARSYLFVTENENPNRSRWIDFFNRSAGAELGSPWCMTFLKHVLLEAKERHGIRTNLVISPSALNTWNANRWAQLQIAKPGCIAIWQYGESMRGHGALVIDPLHPVTFTTIEGNTANRLEVVREGDGVYERVRQKSGGPVMKLLGFLDPFLVA